MPATCCGRSSRELTLSEIAAHAPTGAPPPPAAETGRRVRWRRQERSAGSRFGLIYAGVFAASTIALALFLWWATAGLLERQTDAAINADAQGLTERYATAGLAALEATIRLRLESNTDDDALYLLVDPLFAKLAGNLPNWPQGVGVTSDWSELAIDRAGKHVTARVRHVELSGGYQLLVGRDVEVHAHMTRLLTDALLWSAGVALVLGTAGAIAVRSLFHATLSDVSATAAAISAGDLTRRVRVSGRNDEFDRLAETINDMLGRIARLMDGVRQVSNAIAHDLRTPIARARARLEDATIHAAGEADLRAAIERAESDLDDVIAIFQALLRIAEIEAGARRSAFADLDLTPLLADLAELYGAAAEDRGITLRAALPPKLAVFGDREMIQQALANLLDNALKFSPPGSTVQLNAEPQTHSRTATGVRVVVADQGPGIPAADLGRATERFFRGESARSTPGSGLGLALVQAVATLHGGSLRLEDNQPGLRAVMTIVSPQHSRDRFDAGAEMTGSSS
jgi:signal transduction histidine kinase